MYLRAWAAFAALVLWPGFTAAQSQPLQPQSRQFTINGRTGQASLVQINGHSYIELEALARITNGTLGFQGNRIVLSLPMSSASSSPQQPVGLSREFMRAGVDELGAVRDWVTALSFAVQNGYPVSQSWVDQYQGRAVERLRQAAVSAATASDRQAMQLLNDLFGNLQTWSSNLVTARQALDAELAVNPSAVQSDPIYQKLTGCEQFLSSMLVSGTFTDNVNCH